MSWRDLIGIASVVVLAFVLWDAFETVIVPRTVARRLRISRLYYGFAWSGWRRIASAMKSGARRERVLAIFGPLALVALAAIWVSALILAFAGLQWAIGSRLHPLGDTPFVDDLYMSATTFLSLGLGDVLPTSGHARLITVMEAATGFGFLATIITYLPVLYQAFSRREAQLTLLDAWAGSPPSGAEVLRRLASRGELDRLQGFLKDWEYWCSEVLESHISYPALAFFRSQHQRQSWIAALSAILDLTSLVEVGIDGVPTWQAHATFAIARHASVDLTQVLNASTDSNADRLSAAALEKIRAELEAVGLTPNRSADANAHLAALRQSYEPFICGLSREVMMPVAPWCHSGERPDNWETNQRRAEDPHW